MDWLAISIAVIGVFFTIIGYLLNRKDQTQSGQINLLFAKHDQDVKDLQELRVKLAENHYSKHELDDRINRMETAFREGIKSLNDKMDKILSMMIENK